MATDLPSKPPHAVVDDLRARLAETVQLWRRWGLIPDAEAELAALEGRIESCAPLGELLREPWFNRARLIALHVVLVETREQELLDRRGPRGLRSAAPVASKNVRAMADTLRQLAASTSSVTRRRARRGTVWTRDDRWRDELLSDAQ